MFTMLKCCKVKLSWCLSFDFRWKTELAVLDVCVFSSDGGGKLLCCKTATCKHCSELWLTEQWLQTHHIRTLHSSRLIRKNQPLVVSVVLFCILVKTWLNYLYTHSQWALEQVCEMCYTYFCNNVKSISEPYTQTVLVFNRILQIKLSKLCKV